MKQLELDPFSICFYPSSGTCLDKALAFWLQLHEKIVSGTVYVILCTDISSEIVQSFSSEKYVWSCNPVCSIAALFEKIDCLTHCDSVVVAGIETIVFGDIGSIAGQLDRLYEVANKKLSGLTVLWRADQDYCNQVVDALQDSNNMSISNMQDISAEEAMQIPWAIADRPPEEVLALIEQSTPSNQEEAKAKYAEELQRNGRFQDAAFVFRQLSGKAYNMRARLNDLFANKEKQWENFQNYAVLPFQDDMDVFQEAILQAANYLYDNQHYYSAYCALSAAHISHDSPLSEPLIRLKLSILSDTAEASRALRKLNPYSREGDAQKLANERCRVLLESIPILVAECSGYYRWRGFLDCQENSQWDMGLIHVLEKIAARYISTDWQSLLDQSPLYHTSHEKHGGDSSATMSETIDLLRNTSFIEQLALQDRTGSSQVMAGAKAKALLEGTVAEQIWTQYYIACNTIRLVDDPQQSINECLSLMERISSLDGENQELCTSLALLAWANLSYRIDRYQESIACCIAALSGNLDAIPVLEDAFTIIVKYVLACAQKGLIKDPACFIAFFKAISPYNQTAEAAIPLFSKDFQLEISKMKARIDGKAPHDSNWVIDISNLVQLLMQEGSEQSRGEAAQYVIKYHEEAERLLSLREDSAHLVLYTFAQTLLHAAPTPQNLFICISLLESAINKCLARKSSNHQDERASLSISLDSILREQLFVCGMLYQCRDLAKEDRMRIKGQILRAASLHIPSSVIEQKEYNSKYASAFPDDPKIARLTLLKQQYYKISHSTAPDIAALKTLAGEINLLSQQLNADHPGYKPLEAFEGTDWEKVCNMLPEHDVLYQYIIAKNVVVSILCSRTGVEVICRAFQSNPKEMLEYYGQRANDISATDADAEQITKLLSTPLMAYAANHSIQRVFVISDMDYSTFPLAAAQMGGKKLIDHAAEIINLIDYTAIERYIHTAPDVLPAFNRLYGERSDPSIRSIYRWLEKQKSDSFLFDYSSDDSMTALADDERIKNTNTVVIYGHGVSGFSSGEASGALRIEGISQHISLGPVISGLKVKNLIIISCLSGATNEETPETSKGVWKSVLEAFSGNIVLCRWSVPTKETIELIEKVFYFLRCESITLGCALVRAQRELSREGLCANLWAGVEFWIN